MSIHLNNQEAHKIYLGNIQIGEVYKGSDLIYKSEKIIVGDVNSFGKPEVTTFGMDTGSWLGNNGVTKNNDGTYSFSIHIGGSWGSWNAHFPNDVDTDGYEYLKFTYTFTQFSNISSYSINIYRKKKDGTSDVVKNSANGTLNKENELYIPIKGYDYVDLWLTSQQHANGSSTLKFKASLE